jgi:hypothetical protein
MKKILLTLVVGFLSCTGFSVGKMTPMHMVEKSSYQISSLIKKNKIDASFLTDISDLSVKEINGEFLVGIISPSNQQNIVNALDLVLGLDGKLKSFSTHFNGVSGVSPILTGINAAQVLDLGAEAFVDHLAESQENVLVAETVTHIKIEKVESGAALRILLSDNRIYSLILNNNGEVVSRGF